MKKKYLMPIALVCGLTTAFTPLLTACNKPGGGGGGGDEPVINCTVDLADIFSKKYIREKTEIISEDEHISFAEDELAKDYVTYVKNEPFVLIEDILFAISDQIGVHEHPASGKLSIGIENVDPETEIVIRNAEAGEEMIMPSRRMDINIVADNLDFTISDAVDAQDHYQINGNVYFKGLPLHLEYDEKETEANRRWIALFDIALLVSFSIAEQEGFIDEAPDWSMDIQLSFKRETSKGFLDEEFEFNTIFSNDSSEEELWLLSSHISSSFAIFLLNPIPLQFLTNVGFIPMPGPILNEN